MKVKSVLVLLCCLYGISAVPMAQPDVKKLSLRRMLVHCLDTQANESASTDDSTFTSCLAAQIKDSGEVKILPGVVMSSENIEDGAVVDPNGGRSMTSGRSIKFSLPWSNATARWLGGWGNPSLVLTGDTSAMDVAVELNKNDPDDESRGKKLRKLLLPLMIGLKLKSAIFGLLSYGAVAALAGKALFVSVASLIVSAVIGMRRMYSSTWEATPHTHSLGTQYTASYEPTYYHHHRSYEAAAASDLGTAASSIENAQVSSYVPSATSSQLAYKAYSPEG